MTTLTITCEDENVDQILDALQNAEEEGEITGAFNVVRDATAHDPDAVAVAELADRMDREAEDLEDLERMAAGDWTGKELFAGDDFVGGKMTHIFKRLICGALTTKATVACGRA